MAGSALELAAGDLDSSQARLESSDELQMAIDALTILERYNTFSREQMAFYFDTAIATDPATLDSRRLELFATTNGMAEVRERFARTLPQWADRIRAIEATSEARSFTVRVEEMINPVGEADSGLDVSRLQVLGQTFEWARVRDAALGELFRDARAEVDAEADAFIAAARSERQEWVWISAAFFALSLGVAFGVSVLIRRPLARLEQAALLVSEGRLDETAVSTGGPREIATVGAALHEVVSSLQAVSARASTLALGELDVVGDHEPLHGPLGDAIEATVDRLVASMQEQADLRAKLAHEATHDALTGLPNRAGVLAHLHDAVERASTSGRTIGLLFVDLDGFKQANDLYGHRVGDAVLVEVARRLAAVCRSSDVVGRLGGDEFIVLVEPVNDIAHARAAADRFAEALNGSYRVAGDLISMGASVGVTIADGVSTAESLLADADLAVYRAKSLGRGRVEVFEPALRADLEDQRRLERDLLHALEHNELALHYQPIVQASDSAPVGVEALVRWHRPGVGLVLPVEFIAVAERSSLIVQLGQWVLDTAVAQIAAWSADPEMGPIPVAVNASPRELLNRAFVGHVRDVLDRHGVDASLLTIEITETAVLDDMVLASEQLHALTALGVKVAIDDFGTGYASFAQLAMLPVHAIKIDRSFTANLDDPRQAALARLMVDAGRTLNLAVVAEGIEQASHAAQLVEMGCRLGQGFLFSKPAPAEDIRRWYLANRAVEVPVR